MKKNDWLEQKLPISGSTAAIARVIFPEDLIANLDGLLNKINIYIHDFESGATPEAQILKNYARDRNRVNDTDVDFRAQSLSLLMAVRETKAGQTLWHNNPQFLKAIYLALSEDIKAAKSLDDNMHHAADYDEALQRLEKLDSVLPLPR